MRPGSSPLERSADERRVKRPFQRFQRGAPRKPLPTKEGPRLLSRHGPSNAGSLTAVSRNRAGRRGMLSRHPARDMRAESRAMEMRTAVPFRDGLVAAFRSRRWGRRGRRRSRAGVRHQHHRSVGARLGRRRRRRRRRQGRGRWRRGRRRRAGEIVDQACEHAVRAEFAAKPIVAEMARVEVLTYLLKPALKASSEALRER